MRIGDRVILFVGRANFAARLVIFTIASLVILTAFAFLLNAVDGRPIRVWATNPLYLGLLALSTVIAAILASANFPRIR